MKSKVKKLFLSNFNLSVKESDKPWLVKFTSDTCALCIGLEPVFDQLALAFQDRINFGNVNVRVEKRLSKAFIKDGVPTIFYFHRNSIRELEWPSDPNPDSGYSFEDLSEYLLRKIKENE
tara:strand:+ start:312 stop:671 length:360 start_codon:yes stop_codon:yes gene_type:complete